MGANDQLLGRFYKADLNSFSIVKSKLHRYGADFLFLVEMLRLQKNLKKLRIGGYFKNTDFTDKAICFKLESLEMEYCIFDEFWEFYREFLERQVILLIQI